jgi:ADP-heptose:LPS heptosyltransferase
MEEARSMRELDLLITVDTCSAHLAGALGVPVWTLLPYHADWRWMRDREDTPWYPTMRLLRQRVAGEWSEVIERVVARLAAPAANIATNMG